MQPTPPQEFFDAQERSAARHVRAVIDACDGRRRDLPRLDHRRHAALGSDHRLRRRRTAAT
jgi:hypothetical protein